MNYILFDDETWSGLLPLTFTRPVAEVRVGILTIREKWERYLKTGCSFLTKDYLSKKFLLKKGADNILLNGSVLPENGLLKSVKRLKKGQALCKGKLLIAVRVNVDGLEKFNYIKTERFDCIEYEGDLQRITKIYHVFAKNDEVLRADFDLITHGRVSQRISETVNVLGRENIFIEEGAKIEFATLNAKTGPIYIGKNTEIMEGTLIRGPFAMGENSIIKMGAKIYGATTLGPYCKCGGELNNVVLFGYSSKAHDGFLGNAVLGEWCNIGADTNNSNLNNNYSEVKMWSYMTGNFEKTGMQFCGLVMGDHNKCSINVVLNTGTVVGFSSNIHGAGFPRKFIPSFALGGSQGFEEYRFKKACEVAELVMKRRNRSFDKIEQDIFSAIFDMTKEYRYSFKK